MKTIEFLGMPRAGKTEQIERLSRYFSKKKVSHRIITDRQVEKEITCPPEKAFEYNMLFFKKILEKVKAAEQDSQLAVLILDRGFIDGQIWFDVEYERGKLSKEEKKKATGFLRPLQKKYVDLGILMMISPSLTFQRHERKGEHSLTDDYVMTEEYVNGLYYAYQSLKNKLAKKKNILILDGTLDMDELEKMIRKKAGLLV
jgi:thymidylate kinase